MKRILSVLALVCVSALTSFAQGGPVISGGITILGPTGRPLAGATVTICNVPASGIPCTNTALIYTDLNLTTPASNPTVSDGLGNVSVYAAQGNYAYTVTGPGINPQGPFPAAVNGGGAVTPATDCSNYPGADFGAKWNACLAGAPVGSVLTFAKFTSPQTMTTAVDVNKSVWNDMAGLQVTQQAGVTVSTSAVISKGEFDQAFNGDQFTITASAAALKNLTIVGDDGTNTGRGVVINSGTNYVVLDTDAVEFHSSHEIQDDGGTSFGPNTIQNCLITFDGGAGLRSTGGDNVLNVNFNWSGTGAGNAILQPSINFASLIRIDNSTFNGNQAAAMISAPNVAAIIISKSQLFTNGGYPAIDAPNGGLLHVTTSSVTGGSVAHGPAIRYGTSGDGFSGLQILGNYNINGLLGNAIEAKLAQGAQIDKNELITSDFSGQTGGCVVKIEGALGGSVSDNGISVVGYAAFTGPNYGICYVPTLGIHSDNLYVHHNTITGQSSGDTTKSVGMIWDNSAGEPPDFADHNIWDSNICIDIGTCITRVSPTWNNTNFYSNNTGVAVAQIYDATGSTNDVVTGFGATFAMLPVGGNGSQGYCADCTVAVPTAGGGPGAPIVRSGGQWGAYGGAIASAAWSGLTPGTNSTAGSFVASGNSWDYTAASHTLPIKTGTVAAKPATCTFTAGSKMEVYLATDATAGQNFYFCTATNTWTNQINSGAGGMTTSGSNAAATAVGSSWIPGAVNTDALGSAALPWTQLFLSTRANQAASFDTSNLTANRSVVIPDAASIVPQAKTCAAHQFFDVLNATSGALTCVQPAIGDISGITFSGSTNELGTVTGAVTSGHVATWDASGNLQDGGTAVSNSSTNTFTNKTMDQEGTGNVLTTVSPIWVPAAGANGASAGPVFILPTSAAPSPQPLTGTNVNTATLDYDDSLNEFAQTGFRLPHTWVGNVDVSLVWLVIAGGGSNAVKWTVQTSCSADGATFDTAYNAAQTITTNVAANNLQTVSTQSAVTTTGCAVDNMMNFKIGRDTTDTFTGTAKLLGAKFTVRHTGN